MKHPIIYPMIVYVLYLFALALFIFRARVMAIKSGKASFKYFRAFTGEAPPEELIVAGRHYDNQFQLPMLFLITCTLYVALNFLGPISVIFAWLFVVSRVLHSFVHLGRNRVGQRAATFALGWICIIAMWIPIIFGALYPS